MEECCTCRKCVSQSWVIYQDRIECSKCGKTYSFSVNAKAYELVNLTNK